MLKEELEQIKTNLPITSADFERYLQEERSYLASLVSEPPEETLRFRYVSALQDLENARCV